MINLYGTAYIADALGVSRGAVSNWLKRYADCPEPFGTVRSPNESILVWDDAGIEEWHTWKRCREQQADETLEQRAAALRAELERVERKLAK